VKAFVMGGVGTTPKILSSILMPGEERGGKLVEQGGKAK
jgi:hypothetical protein